MGRFVTLPLNKSLLNLLVAVQDHGKAAISLSILKKDAGIDMGDWRKDTKNFYQSLPDHLLSTHLLTNCDANFYEVLWFSISREMLATPPAELGKFEFRFWSEIAN